MLRSDPQRAAMVALEADRKGLVEAGSGASLSVRRVLLPPVDPVGHSVASLSSAAKLGRCGCSQIHHYRFLGGGLRLNDEGGVDCCVIHEQLCRCGQGLLGGALVAFWLMLVEVEGRPVVPAAFGSGHVPQAAMSFPRRALRDPQRERLRGETHRHPVPTRVTSEYGGARFRRGRGRPKRLILR